MAFLQPGCGNLDEATTLLERGNILGACIAHTRAQSSDELVNDFEDSVFALHPEIGEVKERLYKMGATYAAMSGSGSALFGLFRERPDQLDREFPDMFTYSSLF